MTTQINHAKQNGAEANMAKANVCVGWGPEGGAADGKAEATLK